MKFHYPPGQNVLRSARSDYSDTLLVKLQCLRLLRRLNLSRDRSMLISTFLDTYLHLDSHEEEKFRAEFAKINPKEQDDMLKLTNNWFEAGKAEERQRTEQVQRERDAARKRAEQETRRAEILAERLRELGEDPDLLTDLI